jgi:hypothetical protein
MNKRAQPIVGEMTGIVQIGNSHDDVGLEGIPVKRLELEAGQNHHSQEISIGSGLYQSSTCSP